MKIRNSMVPTIAGILMLTASIFNVMWLIAAFTQIVDIKELLRTTWLISPRPYLVLDIGFRGATVISSDPQIAVALILMTVPFSSALGKGSSIIFIFRLPIHAAARPFSVVMLRTFVPLDFIDNSNACSTMRNAVELE
jgi:hypothetical protein